MVYENILAIDPGIANTGYAYRTGSDVLGGTVVTTPKRTLTNRLIHICNSLPGHEPDLLLMEDCYGRFVDKTKILMGAILVSQRPKKACLVPPAKWVRDLFGAEYRGKYKECAQELVKKHKPKTQHEADALALLEWWDKHGSKVAKKS